MFDVAATFLIRVAGAAIAFVLQVVLSRLMPAEDYGYYALAWTLLLAVGSFGTLGFAESAVRFLPRYAERGHFTKTRQFQSFGLRMTLLGSCSAAAFLICLALAAFGPGATRNIMLFVAIALPLVALEYFAEGVARSFGQTRWCTTISYVFRPTLLLAAILILAEFGFEGSYLSVILTVLAVLAITSATLVLTIVSPFSPQASVQQKLFWRSSSFPMMIVSALEDLMSYIDVVLVGILLGPTEAAIYFASGRILVLAGFANHAVYTVYGRLFSIAQSVSDLKAQIKQSRVATIVTLGSAIAVTFSIVVFGPFLLSLFGEEFRQGYQVLLVLGIAIICKAASGQSHELLLMQGKQSMLMLINGASLLLAFVLLVWGIHQAGSLGAASAMTLAWAARSSLLLWAVSRQFKAATLQTA